MPVLNSGSTTADSALSDVLAERRRWNHASSLKPYLLTAGAVAVAWMAVHALQRVPGFPLDDPYITLHSAQVLHWGFDPNYPGVSALSGSTSAPYLGLVYLLLFVLPPLFAIETACWLGVLAYTAGLVYLTRALHLTKWESFGVIAIGLTSSFVPVHLLNGLETSWAIAGVIWTLGLSSHNPSRLRLCALTGGITAAIRPDLLPFTLLVLCAATYERWREEELSFRSLFYELSVALGLVLLLVVPFALCYKLATGAPYPLTGEAKRYYFNYALAPASMRLEMMQRILRIFVVSCGPLLVGFGFQWRLARAKAILAFGALVVVASFTMYPDGFAGNAFRYSVVLVPMMVWATAECVARSRRTGSGRLLLAGCVMWAAAVAFPYAIRLYLDSCRTFDGELRDLVSWCDQNLRPDATLLVQDAGYVAYGSQFKIVDYVGLKTPEAIQLNRQLAWPNLGPRRAEPVAALSTRHHAEYLVTLSRDSPSTDFPEELIALGWRVEPVRNEGLYRVYRLQAPPSGGKAGLVQQNTPSR